jgi:hypothetical protein
VLLCVLKQPRVNNTSSACPFRRYWSNNLFKTGSVIRCLLTSPPHLLWCSYSSIFSLVCSVLQTIVCVSSFGHCIVCTSIYGFISVFKLFLTNVNIQDYTTRITLGWPERYMYMYIEEWTQVLRLGRQFLLH